MPLSTIFQCMLLKVALNTKKNKKKIYRGDQFHWWRKVTDKLYLLLIMVVL